MGLLRFAWLFFTLGVISPIIFLGVWVHFVLFNMFFVCVCFEIEKGKFIFQTSNVWGSMLILQGVWLGFPRLRTPPSLTWLWSHWLKNYLCRVTPRSIQRFGLLNVLAPWFSSLLFWWWSTILPYHTREHIHIKYEICTVCLYDIHVYMNVFNYDQIGATAATLKALHFHLCCWMGNPQSFWSITETPQVGCIPIPRSNHGQKNTNCPSKLVSRSDGSAAITPMATRGQQQNCWLCGLFR